MNDRPMFPGRLGLQQRVLPTYRVPFFELLAESCEGGLGLFAGAPRPDESISSADGLGIGDYRFARNVHLLRGSLYLCYQGGLPNWLADWNPDALIVEANPRYLTTPSAVQWMHARGRGVIGWGLGAPSLAGPLAGFRQTRRTAFLSRFDALIAYSQRGADEYAGLGFPPEKIFVAPNAVAPRPTAEPPKREVRFGDRPVVLFIGRLQTRKRVDFLLRACAEMPEPG